MVDESREGWGRIGGPDQHHKRLAIGMGPRFKVFKIPHGLSRPCPPGMLRAREIWVRLQLLRAGVVNIHGNL